jgi:ubiquinone/menaquinone biosynthesis C-methylase UbiE
LNPAAGTRDPLTFEKLQELIDAHYRFQLLNAAVKFDLFTLLRAPTHPSDLARALRMDAKPLGILLMGCEALGLLEQNEGLYRSSEVAVLALARDAPFDQRALVRFAEEVTYPAARRLYEALRDNRNAGIEILAGEGATLYARLVCNPDAARAFEEMMGTVTRHVTGRLLPEIAFPDGGRLLDVAGGACEMALALARRWPKLEVTVMDLPWVIQGARAKVRDAGLEDRIRLEGRDAFEGGLPACDYLVLAHFLEIWSETRCRDLLRAAARALPPGGGIYLVNMVRPDEGAVGFGTAAASLYFHAIASGEGLVRRWCDYEEWLKEAGFVPERRVALTPMHGLIISRREP